MSDTISTAKGVLDAAGYRSTFVALEAREGLMFEDDTLMGFATQFSSVDDLLKSWSQVERGLLTKYAHQLRQAADKAWNVYFVCFTDQSASVAEARRVQWIEENVERTRKLSGVSIETRADVVRMLLPLLPIQFRPAIEQLDVTKRLQTRAFAIAPEISTSVLDLDVSISALVDMLQERT